MISLTSELSHDESSGFEEISIFKHSVFRERHNNWKKNGYRLRVYIFKFMEIIYKLERAKNLTSLRCAFSYLKYAVSKTLEH